MKKPAVILGLFCSVVLLPAMAETKIYSCQYQSRVALVSKDNQWLPTPFPVDKPFVLVAENELLQLDRVAKVLISKPSKISCQQILETESEYCVSDIATSLVFNHLNLTGAVSSVGAAAIDKVDTGSLMWLSSFTCAEG